MEITVRTENFNINISQLGKKIAGQKLICLKISIRTEISRIGNSLFRYLNQGRSMQERNFPVYIFLPGQKLAGQKWYFFENLYQDRNQKNKDFTRLISYLGQKHAGQNFLCFYTPIRIEIRRHTWISRKTNLLKGFLVFLWSYSALTYCPPILVSIKMSPANKY